jgi:hypothetical protein
MEVCRPASEKDRGLATTVPLRLVEVREIDPPEGVEPVLWRLLTTHEVNTEADAWRIVCWHQARWIIEQLFWSMKSQGLGLEDSQMATAGRLLKLAAVAAKAACVIMQLVQERDGTHGLAASVAFEEVEIDTIEAVTPTLEGKTERQKNPVSAVQSGTRDLGHGAAWWMELLLQARRTDHHAARQGTLPCHPSRAAPRIEVGTRCETPLAVEPGHDGGNCVNDGGKCVNLYAPASDHGCVGRNVQADVQSASIMR